LRQGGGWSRGILPPPSGGMGKQEKMKNRGSRGKNGREKTKPKNYSLVKEF